MESMQSDKLKDYARYYNVRGYRLPYEEYML